MVWILAFARMTFSDNLLTTPPPSRWEGGRGMGIMGIIIGTMPILIIICHCVQCYLRMRNNPIFQVMPLLDNLVNKKVYPL